MELHRQLNIGSGRDFRQDCLNIDISDYGSPDIVADLGQPFPSADSASFNTHRFGEITIGHDQFDTIIANDVLEHVPNLIGMMTNCLNMLRLGGRFQILVPYDLSLGAWQDPTHIRGFNENSWFYYTEWFWYIGWTKYRFKLSSLDYVLSPYGGSIQNKRRGLFRRKPTIEEVARTPRAVDAMQVELEKIACEGDDLERQGGQAQTQSWTRIGAGSL